MSPAWVRLASHRVLKSASESDRLLTASQRLRTSETNLALNFGASVRSFPIMNGVRISSSLSAVRSDDLQRHAWRVWETYNTFTKTSLATVWYALPVSSLVTSRQEKVLLDGVIEPLKKYAKEESNVAGVRKSILATAAATNLSLRTPDLNDRSTSARVAQQRRRSTS